MKRLTRILSLVLVCAMALCVFTACSGSSTVSESKQYMLYLGASTKIREDQTLTKAANAIASKVNNIKTLADFDNSTIDNKDNLGRMLYAQITSEYGIFGYLTDASGHESYRYASSSKSDINLVDKYYSSSFSQGALAQYISNMDYYGMADFDTTINGINIKGKFVLVSR